MAAFCSHLQPKHLQQLHGMLDPLISTPKKGRKGAPAIWAPSHVGSTKIDSARWKLKDVIRPWMDGSD